MSALKAQEWRFGEEMDEEARRLDVDSLVKAMQICRRVHVERAIISADLDLSGGDYGCSLTILNSRFDGFVDLRESRFDRSVDFSGCEFTRGLDLTGAQLKGSLHLEEAKIGVREVASSFEQIRIQGHLRAGLLTASSSLDLQQADIGGYVDLRGAAVHGNLTFDDARICGSLFANSCVNHRTEVDGAFSLTGIRVGRDISIRGILVGKADLLKEQTDVGDVSLTLAEIGGSLFCGAQDGTRTEILGILMLQGARIGHQVLLHGAEVGGLFRGRVPPNNALILQSVEIKGGLYCEPHNLHPTEIHGHVYGVSAQITHRLDFDRAIVHGDIDLRRAVVNGLFMCAYDEEWYEQHPCHPSAQLKGLLRVDGEMILSGAKLDEFTLDGRLFDSAKPGAVLTSNLFRRALSKLRAAATFLRGLIWGQAESSDKASKLRMDRARIVKWRIIDKVPERIDLDGLKLDEVELPNRCSYVDLLSKMHPFRKSTYLAFESFLRNKGFDDEAEDVYIAMCKRDLPMGRTQGLGGAGRRAARWLFLGVLLGYGARPLRLIIAILLVLGLSLVLFSHPAALAAKNPGDGQPTCPGELQGFWTSLEVALCCHFPMFRFLDDPACVPSLNALPGLGITYRHYALVISVLSWVLVPLALIGLTGIVRQKE